MCHRQENCSMTIPYRVRRGLQRFFVALGVLALFAAVAIFVWMLWLNRYVIYTDEGAKLDFSLSFEHSKGEIAQPPTPGPSVPISYGNTDELLNNPAGTLTRVSGYTITLDMLTNRFDDVKTKLDTLPASASILLEVKNLRGQFYYTTALGRTPDNVDTQAVTQLISDLKAKGHYLIAQIPAFRDFWYFIDDEATRVPYGLPKAGGTGSLWEDKSIKNMTHYWFNPASNGALNFLVQVTTELRSVGFDEVVFTDFRFPNTEGIRFDGDKTEALTKAAKTLVQACASDTFAVSFAGTSIELPEGRCRVYIENTAAADIADIIANIGLENPDTQVVFLTDLMDSRYDAYGVLRPIDMFED